MTCTSCTDEIREKVPSFQKVTFFLQYQARRKQLQIGGGGAHITDWGAHIIFFIFYFFFFFWGGGHICANYWGGGGGHGPPCPPPLFLRPCNINHNTEPCFCLFEVVTGYGDIRRINLKSFVSIGLVFATEQHKPTLLAG